MRRPAPACSASSVPLRACAGWLPRLLLALLPLGAPALAQLEDQRLLPGGAVPGLQFGNSLEIEGSLAVIGARGDLDLPMVGAAYVYARGATGWVEQQELGASDGAPGDYFGASVDLSGDTIVVGSLAGKAYVFVFDGSRWVQQAILQRPGGGFVQFFGGRALIDGDTIVLTSPREGLAGVDSGAAFVYVRSAGQWQFQQRLTPSDSAAGDFVSEVAIEGDTLLLGAPGKASSTGAVYAFTRTAGVWSEQQKLGASTGAPHGHFGIRIALDGERAAIGATGADGSEPRAGAVHLFERSGSSWSERARLVACDGSSYDQFGGSLALSGDALLVGAQWDEDHGNYSGSAYLFRRAGTTWIQARKLVPSDASERLFCGAVAVDGDSILLGAQGHDGGGANTGLVCAFHLTPSTVSHYNGAGVNVDTLRADDTHLGASWSASVAVVSPLPPGVAFLALSSACARYPALAGSAEVLIGGRLLPLSGPLAHGGLGSSAVFTLSVPAAPALLGRRWAAQCALLGGGAIRLTSAATGTFQ